MANTMEATAEYQQILSALQECASASPPDPDRFQRAMLRWFDLPNRQSLPDPALQVWATPPDPQQLATLPPPIRLYVLHAILRENLITPGDLQSLLVFFSQPTALAGIPARFHAPFHYLHGSALLLADQTAAARQLYRRHGRRLTGYGLEGWLTWQERNPPAVPASAIRFFQRDLKLLRRREENPTAYFTGPEGLIYLLALLADDNHRHINSISAILDDLEHNQPHNPLLPAYQVFRGVLAILENRPVTARNLLLTPTTPPEHALATLLLGLACHWLSGHLPADLQSSLRQTTRLFRRSGMEWPAQLGAQLLAGHDPLAIIEPREPWHQALLTRDQSQGLPTESEPGRRLAWLLEPNPTGHGGRIKAVIQHRLANGYWSKGRPVARRRLTGTGPLTTEATPITLDYRDQQLRTALRQADPPGRQGFFDLSDFDPAALLNHPHLFLAQRPEVRIKLEAGRPIFYLEHPDHHQLRLSIAPYPDRPGTLLVRQGLAEFQLITFTLAQYQLALRLGPEGRSLPPAQAPALLTSWGGIPPGLTVLSQLEEIFPLSPENRQEPMSHPILQLLPAGNGLRLRIRVRPLGREGPCLQPGLGPFRLRTEIGELEYHVRRDLAAETRLAAPLAALISEKAEPDAEDHFTWSLPEPAGSLELLARLPELVPPVALEWPEGEGFSLSPTVGLNQLHLKIGQRNNWFELSGELALDQGLVLELEQLLIAARTSHGRFIDLGQGRFLTLSRALRRKLDEIAAYGEISRGEIRLHPLAAHLLTLRSPESSVSADPARESAAPATPATNDAPPTIQGDPGWHAFLARLQSGTTLPAPQPPGLKARLRDYQLTGYQWLQQLAELGFGACLADDMGLGKTVQALALIVARSPAGPSLVVTPTSVVANWLEEATRFTPGLRLVTYQSGNRLDLDELGPGDLVVTSYSMLQRDGAIMARRHWRTIVLDEAQAIKNLLAKRSRAAMGLNGDCKIITTGTPLENHLGELWNLFRFINPGLLGSLEHFSRHFIIPIEQHDDANAGRRLKKLLTPFILRRLKTEVLAELPPRTEITLQVELSREESALYEALRRRALNELRRDGTTRGNPLRVLAEIMKLRRVCCHPRLVVPESELVGSKLALFAKVITELLENGHKILVFSQFVDHLTIIRELLDQRRLNYQYLDGSTPAKLRQQRVRAFQRGQGDLFLISLRAGGLGLNLTAADYVIHLDPWWNPAVEDQASDRAHRIGQQRPVTIYRLITTGTIEEKIRALHQRKRKLAADLIDHGRVGPPRTREELLDLLT